MFNASDYRIYYFSKGAQGYRSHVALSPTPVGPWHKPELGLFDVNGSTANNVGGLGIIVAVFLDDRPGVPASERIKAVSGSAVLVSPDGFRWSAPTMAIGWAHFADTQPVVFWDHPSEQYIAGGRIDADWNVASGSVDSGAPACLSQPFPSTTPSEGPGASRSVGVAVSPRLENGTFATATLALGANQSRAGSGDSACVDLYTSALVRYEDVMLMFPSAYYHFRHTDPPNAPAASAGRGNDGVLSVRLAYARAPPPPPPTPRAKSLSSSSSSISSSPDKGHSSSSFPGPFSYVDAAQPAAEWLPRGAGRFLVDDWRFDGQFDAGHVFMTRGLLHYTAASPSTTVATIPMTSQCNSSTTTNNHHQQQQHAAAPRPRPRSRRRRRRRRRRRQARRSGTRS